MLEDWRGPPTWQLHTVLNISTNISALRQRTHLKLGELSSIFIVYNTTIFLLYPFHSFWFFLLLRDSAYTLFSVWVVYAITSTSTSGWVVLLCKSQDNPGWFSWHLFHHVSSSIRYQSLLWCYCSSQSQAWVWQTSFLRHLQWQYTLNAWSEGNS